MGLTGRIGRLFNLDKTKDRMGYFIVRLTHGSPSNTRVYVTKYNGSGTIRQKV